jgi:RNA polymerase sigma-70 factor, ECF subfamily
VNKIDNNLVKHLLNLIAGGDIKAATQLFSSFQGSVYAFIRLQVPNDAVAEEILNETFMIAFSKPTRFDGSSTFTTWLCGIAKNLCRNWHRKDTGEREVFSRVDFDEIPAELMQDPNPSLLANLERQELQRALLICIDRLPEAQREAMYWVFLEELSVDDVAKQMSCPVGTIKSRLYYARAKVAECMKLAFGLGAANV